VVSIGKLPRTWEPTEADLVRAAEADWRGRGCSLSQTWRRPSLDLGAETEAGGLPSISSLQRGRIDAEPGSLTWNPASERQRRRSVISPGAVGPD